MIKFPLYCPNCGTENWDLDESTEILLDQFGFTFGHCLDSCKLIFKINNDGSIERGGVSEKQYRQSKVKREALL
jgi:hypothetical protein